MSNLKRKFGLDIGGTDVKGAIVDADGCIEYAFSHSTNAKSGFGAIKNAIENVVTNLVNTDKTIKSIGIASAGNIDCKNGAVSYATDNLPGYTGFRIADFVEQKFGLLAKCDNDAYCALKGEMFCGSAKGFSDVLMLTLGTGVGGACALNGEILHGNNFDAARFGHMVFVPNGIQCNCGQKGCAEKYLSGTAFTLGAIAQGFDIVHGSELYNFFQQGDKRAEKYIVDFFEKLAIFVTSLNNAFSPQAIIIGGGLISSREFWWDNFTKLCNVSAKILPAKLKNTAGIIGASTLV